MVYTTDDPRFNLIYNLTYEIQSLVVSERKSGQEVGEGNDLEQRTGSIPVLPLHPIVKRGEC